MPVNVRVDERRELVLVTIYGVVEYEDLSGLRRTIPPIPRDSGYSVIVDLSNLWRMPQLSSDQIGQLATLFLQGESSSGVPPRLALVVSDALQPFARAFEARCNENTGLDRVAVFPTLSEAAAFLNLSPDSLPKDWFPKDWRSAG